MSGAGPFDLIAVGCSWGGLAALSRVLGDLPPDLDVALVVAQHRGTGPSTMSSLLGRHTSWPVCEAEDKEGITSRRVYVAPPDYHLLVEPGHLALSTEAPVRYSRPSIDVLFDTAANAYKDRLIAVMLTGANDDGTAGLCRVVERGGKVVVQDPSTAERAEMPRAALASGIDAHVVPLDEMGRFLADLCRGDVKRQDTIHERSP